MKIDDRLFLPIVQPMIAGNPAVVLVDFAVAASPVVKLASADAHPHNEPSGADLRFAGPAPDEIHDLVPHIMCDADPG